MRTGSVSMTMPVRPFILWKWAWGSVLSRSLPPRWFKKKELYADRLKTAISQPMLSLHTIPLICRNAPAHLLSIWTPCTQIFHKPAPRISAFRLKISVIHFKICIRMFKLARIQMRQVDLLCKGQRLPVFKPALHIQMF